MHEERMVYDREKQRDITAEVTLCEDDGDRWRVQFGAGKTYTYGKARLEVMDAPECVDPSTVRLSHQGKALSKIQGIALFTGQSESYWRVAFENGSKRTYLESRLHIRKSCLQDKVSNNCFEYLKRLAGASNLKGDEGQVLLKSQYSRIDFIGADTALAVYLNPGQTQAASLERDEPICPFGSNESQFQAVQKALRNQVSVIEGPPGTGKTQTILNIIANLLLRGKSVQVVSNNNSAIANVLEKLSSSKYQLDFVVALLGKKENKEKFIQEQTGAYPDLRSWSSSKGRQDKLKRKIASLNRGLHDAFEMQRALASLRGRLDALETEYRHFARFYEALAADGMHLPNRVPLRASRLLALWLDCQESHERKGRISLWRRFKVALQLLNWRLLRLDPASLTALLQRLYYDAEQRGLSRQVATLSARLAKQDVQGKLQALGASSLAYLRGALHSRYGGKPEREVFTEDDLWKTPHRVAGEYPVVLSTTFSSRGSLGASMAYDYLIMDEASQVDLATGALALSCARNLVVVGDLKQLPNVIPRQEQEAMQAIMQEFSIHPGYSFVEHSFLSSICALLPQVPRTLLREHYRCHPKIINFCNQKFYDNHLLVMTEDRQEKDVLKVVKTVPGNHARGRLNQRQIDVIAQELLPQSGAKPSDIGIITPYREQANALRKALSGIEADTVHKFQGREKELVILSTVDNEVTDFGDDPNLLNVAISRAASRLWLVVSDSGQPPGSNMGDFISYIEYNNFQVAHSELHSVFDHLYQVYSEARTKLLRKGRRVSQFDSENLMHSLIVDVLKSEARQGLDVLPHYPLRALLKDTSRLSHAERRYALHSLTHVDFLIYNRVRKSALLAVEVDGFKYHRPGTAQHERDSKKNRVLEAYGIPYIRFGTTESGERARLVAKLRELGQLHSRQPPP